MSSVPIIEGVLRRYRVAPQYQPARFVFLYATSTTEAKVEARSKSASIAAAQKLVVKAC